MTRLALRPLAFGILCLACAARLEAAGRPVTLTASDGVSIAGTFYEAPARPAPAVLLVHMLGRSKTDWAAFADRVQGAGFTVLALDLRGHGQSGGDSTAFAAMIDDVRVAMAWLASRPGVRGDAMGTVGVSLGANLAALAGAASPLARAVALVSPSLDYRGLRLDAATMKRLAERHVLLAASTEDPYALRSLKELTLPLATMEQRLSSVRGHGSTLLDNDPELVRALVDWLQRSLIF